MKELTSTEIHALANWLAWRLDRSTLADLLYSCSRLPEEFVPEDPDSRATYLASWFNALRGDWLSEDTLPVAAVSQRKESPIAFSNTCDSSGAILSTSPAMPAGTRSVYGVFESNSWRPGISYVWTVWRSLDDVSVVFQEAEPINTNASSNYVWLQSHDVWPAGHWQLDLYDPLDHLLLATGTFETH